MDSAIDVKIDPAIFNEYPSFRRGIVIATGMKNRGVDPELESLLREAVTDANAHPIQLTDDPRITVWNEAHRRFGSNPNRFPPAHAALRKRVQKPDARLPFINKAVAIMNLNSIIRVIPVGGDDLDRAGNRLELRKAIGNERFVPLGCPDVIEHPEPGEVAYVNSELGEVLCRRWNWRNSHRTSIAEETFAVLMNIDGLGAESEDVAISVRNQVAGMLEQFCQARVTTALLSPSSPGFSSPASPGRRSS